VPRGGCSGGLLLMAASNRRWTVGAATDANAGSRSMPDAPPMTMNSQTIAAIAPCVHLGRERGARAPST